MSEIYLISCVKSKRNYPCAAEALYTSTLFRKSLAYAKAQKPKKIFILSAKYGLLGLSDEISPYEKTSNKMHKHERDDWAKSVFNNLKNHTNINNDHYVFLAGQRYRDGLIPLLLNYSIPMIGLPFGKQLQWLERNTNV